jgi:hypothetical protein
VQYYGTHHIVLADAVFKPCWNEVLSGDIVLAEVIPDTDEWRDRTFVEYSEEIDLKDINTVLVARNLELTNAGKLRFRSLRALAPSTISSSASLVNAKILSSSSFKLLFVTSFVLSTWGDVTAQQQLQQYQHAYSTRIVVVSLNEV